MLFTRDSLQGPKVEPKKALLLLDFQHDFTSPEGRLYVSNTSTILRQLPSLISKFRETGLIVWAETAFTETCPSLSPQTGGYQVISKDLAQHMREHLLDEESRLAEDTRTGRSPRRKVGRPRLHDDGDAFLGPHIVLDNRCCLAGTPGQNLSSELLPHYDEAQDLMVHKSQYSALGDLSVIMQLRARMVHDLYICGSLSNAGVYATVLNAVQQGFNVTLVEDCLGYREEVCHIESMRRMADDLGANGIDSQELLDDLYGLLGDVIPTTRYTRSFQLSMQKSSARSTPSHSQKVSQWMQDMHDGEPKDVTGSSTQKERIHSQVPEPDTHTGSGTVPSDYESSSQHEISPPGPKHTPSRKRSTSDRDNQTVALGLTPDTTKTLDLTPQNEDAEHQKVIKKSKTDPNLTDVPGIVTQPLSSRGYTTESPPQRPSTYSHSTGHITQLQEVKNTSATTDRTMSEPNLMSPSRPKKTKVKPKQQKLDIESSYQGTNDTIGTGDSKVLHDVLPANTADSAFHKLKNEVAWQKMLHRTGEVPRLVAVQGAIAADGSIPIYRHPADESPELLLFDPMVDSLRQACEKIVGHELNHVLIQHYRTSEDNISEHSDKTLDIVRGSSIVNLSLGAMRTMTLRSKKAPIQAIDEPNSAKSVAPPRPAQRVRLPHNSLFILGERTNANWLHAIRADKRPMVEKSKDELAFDGERISLTFRHIGTFVDLKKRLIWGQGATGKTRDEAHKILHGEHAECVGEDMIIGFGRENHRTDTDFSWNEVYGKGFDVVNFEVKGRET